MVKLGMSLVLATLGLGTAASQAAAQTLTTLHAFNGTDGGNSTAGLILATDGNFYGTTSRGTGAASDGTVFRITPSGVLTTLHTFCSQSGCSDGSVPEGSLIQATDGNLYGTTSDGKVFKITLSGTLTILGNLVSGSAAALVQGTDGNFYGTTVHGGANSCIGFGGHRVSCGTIFKITPTGAVTTLANLSQASGFNPVSSLIQATDGNFYGTAELGGGTIHPGNGTVFKITPAGTFTVLHSFNGTDGERPLGALLQNTDGNFYGTTFFGGGDPDFSGTVFKITPSGTLTTLHSFGSGDGYGPSAALIRATDGNFYGTTAGNGMTLNTIFKITPSGTLTTLHTFNGSDGFTPLSTLVEGANHNLYGTTEYGDNSACYGSCGTVFSLSAGL
jgi:uncharacterized repeat protein (TIGR03803 family)